MDHLQDHHGMDIRVSNVTCPLCVGFTSADRDVLALHIARHMEEIALAILPSGVDSDAASAGDASHDKNVPSSLNRVSEVEVREIRHGLSSDSSAAGFLMRKRPACDACVIDRRVCKPQEDGVCERCERLMRLPQNKGIQMCTITRDRRSLMKSVKSKKPSLSGQQLEWQPGQANAQKESPACGTELSQTRPL